MGQLDTFWVFVSWWWNLFFLEGKHLLYFLPLTVQFFHLFYCRFSFFSFWRYLGRGLSVLHYLSYELSQVPFRWHRLVRLFLLLNLLLFYQFLFGLKMCFRKSRNRLYVSGLYVLRRKLSQALPNHGNSQRRPFLHYYFLLKRNLTRGRKVHSLLLVLFYLFYFKFQLASWVFSPYPSNYW